MAKYTVSVEKTVDYFAQVEIDANDIDHANRMMVDMLGKLDFKIEKVSLELSDIYLSSDMDEDEEDEEDEDEDEDDE